MKVFVSRLLPADSLQPIIDAGWSVDMYEHDSGCPREELLRRSRESDAILAQGTDPIDGEIIKNAHSLKVIACCSIGYDNIDLEEAKSHGVIVCNAPAEDLIAATAEAAVALLLSVAKRITRLHLGQQQEDLPPYSFLERMGLPVRNRVTGIIGLGRIGAKIARIMKRGFDNSVLYFGRSAKLKLERSLGARRFELDDLLAESDFIFVTLPLTNDTRGLITNQNLKNLKRNSIVVNVARAGILDDAALTELLFEDRIFGAALDVYNPATAECKHPNLILTSHMANGETQACEAVLKLAVSNIITVLKGEPPISPVTI